MVYLGLNSWERKHIKAAIPKHALLAATECRKLGVAMRVRVRFKDDKGKQFETDKFCDMRNLIRHYRSHNKRDLLGYAEQAHFNGYMRYRNRLENDALEVDAMELEDYKKKAVVTKPRTSTNKGNTQKWAYALEYPDVRQFKANEVHREAPLSQMRRVIYDIERAAELMRKVKPNREVGWDMNVLEKDANGDRVHNDEEVAAKVSQYEQPPEVQAWVKKAKRHCELYYEMLEEWVEENGRELNLRAVMWNLYYNDFQKPVNEYIELVRLGLVGFAILQFNYCHTKYMKHKAACGWAKLRYWTFCRFPNRLSKICNYWQELAIREACKPPNGRLFREQFMDWNGTDEISPEDQAALEKGAWEGVEPVQEPGFEEIFPRPEKAEEKGKAAKKRPALSGPREESGSESEADEPVARGVDMKPVHDSDSDSDSDSEDSPAKRLCK